jgi:hypothetical protein
VVLLKVLIAFIAYFNRFKEASLNKSLMKSRLYHRFEESKTQITINDPLPFQSSLFRKIATIGQKQFEDIKKDPKLNESVSRILDSSMVQRMINNEDQEENKELLAKGVKG